MKAPLRQPGRNQAAFRPRVEWLEDRLAPSGEPLMEPPVIQSVNGVLTATLTMAQGPATVGDVEVLNAWTYNNSYVGPTLKAKPGDLLDLTVINNLPAGQTTNLHTHGLHVSPIGNSDNVLLTIEPGQDNHFQIQIPADHPEGLYWYHPHHHGTVFPQISLGLSGLLVIGRADGGATQLNGRTQHHLALKNALLAGNQIAVPQEGSDVSAQTFTVNGQLTPLVPIPVGQWHVFNVANIGNNAFYNLQVIDTTTNQPVPLFLLAEDGNPLTKVQTFPNLGFPPGRRWSFTFPPKTSGGMVGTAQPGFYILKTIGFNDGSNQWPEKTLMTIFYVGPAIPLPPAPVAAGTNLTAPNQNFVDLRNIPASQIAAFRTVQFGKNGEIDLINGQPFPNAPIFQPRLNTVEEWTLINPTSEHHPFHLHVNPQQVTKANGQPNGLPQFQDVINVPAGQTVKIRIEWKDFLGEFVYHCHRVDHEDMGMMALVNVVPEATIYAVGANTGAKSRVNVVNSVNGAVVASFLAFPPRFRGGVSVAVGDVNKDGVYDVIVGQASGRGQIKVIDGTKLNQVGANGVILSSALLGSFFAYPASFKTGVFVAAGDADNQFGDEIIVSPVRGARPVRIFNQFGALLRSFAPFGPGFSGGVRVAAGDVNGDGRIDLIAAKGPGSDPRVKVMSGHDQAVIANFLAFEAGFKGGVFVAAGNIKGFGYTDIIVSKGPGSAPRVKVLAQDTSMSDHLQGHHLSLKQIDSFPAYPASYRGGVRVTSLHDVTLLAPSGGNRDAIVTTRATGNGLVSNIFTRNISPP